MNDITITLNETEAHYLHDYVERALSNVRWQLSQAENLDNIDFNNLALGLDELQTLAAKFAATPEGATK